MCKNRYVGKEPQISRGRHQGAVESGPPPSSAVTSRRNNEHATSRRVERIADHSSCPWSLYHTGLAFQTIRTDAMPTIKVNITARLRSMVEVSDQSRVSRKHQGGHQRFHQGQYIAFDLCLLSIPWLSNESKTHSRCPRRRRASTKRWHNKSKNHLRSRLYPSRYCQGSW
jgi:hypothetical protein